MWDTPCDEERPQTVGHRLKERLTARVDCDYMVEAIGDGLLQGVRHGIRLFLKQCGECRSTKVTPWGWWDWPDPLTSHLRPYHHPV